MNIKVTLDDINGDGQMTMCKSNRGNVIIEIGGQEVIVKPDELLRAARLFVTTNTGDTDS